MRERAREKELRDRGDAGLHVLVDVIALLAELALIGNIRFHLEPYELVIRTITIWLELIKEFKGMHLVKF